MAHLLIAAADYYKDITDALLIGVKARLEAENHGYDIVKVSGAFELPATIKLAISSPKPYDGYIALGCVIRGETTHYDLICNECARGLQDLALTHHAAIGFGVLTVESHAQAFIRADVHGKNKGREAAEACLQMIALKKHFAL